MKPHVILMVVLLSLLLLMACWIHQRTEVMIGKPPVAHQVARPATSQAECKRGDWAADESFFYICVGENTWKRVPLQQGSEF